MGITDLANSETALSVYFCVISSGALRQASHQLGYGIREIEVVVVLRAIVSSLKVHGIQAHQIKGLRLDGVVLGHLLILPAHHVGLIIIGIEEHIADGNAFYHSLPGDGLNAGCIQCRQYGL